MTRWRCSRELHRPAEPPPGRRDDHAAVRGDARPCRVRAAPRAASRCSPTRCTSPSWRASTSSPAASRSAASSRRCAQAADDGQAAEAPIVEEGTDGVRLMTVHKAKGLEFPVVILADMTAKLAPIEASRHIDADARSVRAADRRMVAAGPPAPAADRAGARARGRHSRRLRRRDARAGPAGRAGRRRRGVRRRVGESARRRDLSADRSRRERPPLPVSGVPAGIPCSGGRTMAWRCRRR